MTNEFFEGYRAFLRGLTPDDNPKQNLYDKEEWLSGWKSARLDWIEHKVRNENELRPEND